MFKSERPKSHLLEELRQETESSKISPFEYQKDYKSRKMKRQERFLNKRAMLHLFCEILKIDRFRLRELSFKIISHSKIPTCIFKQKLKSKSNLHDGYANQIYKSGVYAILKC